MLHPRQSTRGLLLITFERTHPLNVPTVAVNEKFMFRCKGDSIAFEERTACTMNAVHLSTNESVSGHTVLLEFVLL